MPPTISPSELAQEFHHHHPTVARINNGSFGSCPASILSAQRLHQQAFLHQPDDFCLNHLQPGLLRSRTFVKHLVNAPSLEDISLLDNVTTAAAIVLHQLSVSFQEGDTVVMLSYTYSAIKKAIHAYLSPLGGEVVEARVPFPVRCDDDVIFALKEALVKGKENGRRIRLVVIDHVSSMPSVVLPVKEMVLLCREENAGQVFVDGAHGVGSVHVDVEDIGADFYTSNLHKWFFCPPSVAFLYCKKSPTSSELHHPVVSHHYGYGLGLECAWVGTRDYSAQLVVPSVLDFVNRFEGGLEGIRTRNHEMVVEMGEMLSQAWGTKLGAPPEMCASMVMVGLPPCLEILSENDAVILRTHLRVEFGVEVHIHYQTDEYRVLNTDDHITAYARISHHVYDTVDDYYRFRDAIVWLVQDGLTCKMLRCNK